MATRGGSTRVIYAALAGNALIAAPSLAHDRDLLLVRPATPPLRAGQDLLPHLHTSKRRQ